MKELSDLTLNRRTRLLESVSTLPGILWCVLLIGGFLTVVSITMFGAKDLALHTIQVFSVATLITLTILAIADLDRPFQGWVHISEYAFQRAEENLTELH